MSRAILMVLDSFGLGATPDADQFGDKGADTFGHIVKAALDGRANNDNRNGPLQIPNMEKLGLVAAHGNYHQTESSSGDLIGLYGVAKELSRGKDTPSGHWEMAGLPVQFDWGYFPTTIPCFPEELINRLIDECDLPGILGNCHASGTEIIARLGDEHVASGKPIFYTSADSVLQIAAHEEAFGLDRLYTLCEAARVAVDDLNIGRVIARPFLGSDGDYARTANRRDLAVPPHAPTLLDILEKENRSVISVGKIGDIFAHSGTGKVVKADGNMALVDATLSAMDNCPEGGLIFTNLVDFDQSYGHRRDVAGYANALEEFDKRLPEIMSAMKDDDLLILTADHGCDPTWEGTDHTREVVPVVGYSPSLKPRALGTRETFADIGQTIADYLDIPALNAGSSFLEN